jgi:3-ketosteroid 9alpha-monooxygenase subunit A
MRRINDLMVHGLTEDLEVWSNKRPAIQVMQLPTDGPFSESRIWYSQFYNPRSKVAEIVAQVQGVHRVRGRPSAPKLAAE